MALARAGVEGAKALRGAALEDAYDCVSRLRARLSKGGLSKGSPGSEQGIGGFRGRGTKQEGSELTT